MDVSASYEFKEKDVLRTIGATLLDLSKLHIGRVFERFSVLFGIQRDAYDNFDELYNFRKIKNGRLYTFFFLLTIQLMIKIVQLIVSALKN